MAGAFVIQLKPGHQDRTEEGIRRRRVFIHWAGIGADAAKPGVEYDDLRRLIERAGLGKYELGQHANFLLRMGRGSHVFVPCEGERYVEGVVLSRHARYDAGLGHWREVRWLHGTRKLPRAGLPSELQRAMKLNRTCTQYHGPLSRRPGPKSGLPGGAGRDPRRQGGAGFKRDAAKRGAIEERAVAVASRYYQKRGYEVVKKGKPYDLLCRNGGPPLYVEVKGAAGKGKSVILTRGEVRHFCGCWPDTALFVVAGIRVSGRPPVGRGGRGRPICPWRPEGHRLRPTQYEYAVPVRPQSS